MIILIIIDIISVLKSENKGREILRLKKKLASSEIVGIQSNSWRAYLICLFVNHLYYYKFCFNHQFQKTSMEENVVFLIFLQCINHFLIFLSYSKKNKEKIEKIRILTQKKLLLG